MILDTYLNRKANTTMLVGGIIGIMIGSILIVATYLMLDPLVVQMTTTMTPAFNASVAASGPPSFLTAAQIAGIMLIVAGVCLVVYPLISMGGTAQKR